MICDPPLILGSRGAIRCPRGGLGGFGELGSPSQSAGSDGRVGQRSNDPRSVADTDPDRVLSERFVSDVAEPVFNTIPL